MFNKAESRRRKAENKTQTAESGRMTEICPVCGGEGWEVKEEAPGIEVTTPCPTCKGNRFVYVDNSPTKKTAPLSAAAGK